MKLSDLGFTSTVSIRPEGMYAVKSIDSITHNTESHEDGYLEVRFTLKDGDNGVMNLFPVYNSTEKRKDFTFAIQQLVGKANVKINPEDDLVEKLNSGQSVELYYTHKYYNKNTQSIEFQKQWQLYETKIPKITIEKVTDETATEADLD